jgi:hypothetical protein
MIENRISKVILTDGDVLDVSDIKPVIFDRQNPSEYHAYKRKIKTFQEDILRELDDDVVGQYAKDNFDLIDEDDCDCDSDDSDISDFDDDILVGEFLCRKLNIKSTDIVTNGLIERFFDVLRYGKRSEIELFISEQESKILKTH